MNQVAIANSAQYDLRPATKEDIPFIYGTWLQSYRHDSQIGRSCRKGIFFTEYRQVIDSILADKGTHVLVACHKTIPNVIFGYIVHSNKSLHYIFTKETFRRLGIATSLAKASGPFDFYTHKTYTAENINHEINYNPFLIFKRGE